MENKIIVVTGYCATEKSEFSNKLSNLLNIPCFNKDVIKEVLGEGVGSENDMVEKEGNYTSFLLMLHIAEKMLQAYNICILESNFKITEMDKIKILLEKYNCECLTYIFKGNLEMLYNKHIEKEVLEKRHWVHNTAGETKETFIKGHLDYRVGETGIGKKIVKDSSTFEYVNYDELYNIAKEFVNN